jgi:Family of unknown function (DUF5999)
MCQHQPTCPSATAPDRSAARLVVAHPEQGWNLLCNGVVSFEDTGQLLPDGRIVPPHRPDYATRAARLVGKSGRAAPAHSGLVTLSK